MFALTRLALALVVASVVAFTPKQLASSRAVARAGRLPPLAVEKGSVVRILRPES